MSSLVVQTSFIGDVILTTPLIAFLAQRGAVDVVTTPVGASLLETHPDIRHLIVYDKRAGDVGVRGFLRVARRIRAFDAESTSWPTGERGGGLPLRSSLGWPIGYVNRASGVEKDRLGSNGSLHGHPSCEMQRQTPTFAPPTTSGLGESSVGKVRDEETKVDGWGVGGVGRRISQQGRPDEHVEARSGVDGGMGSMAERGRPSEDRGEPCPPHPTRRAYFGQGSVRSAILAMAAGVKMRVGFETSAGRALYTERVVYRDDWHHARRLLALADFQYAAEAGDEEIRPRVFPKTSDVVAVDALLAGRVRPIVALAPGSVWATKRWPSFVELATRVSDVADVAVVGSAADSAIATEIVRSVGQERVIDATGQLSLLGSAELIRRAVLLVTNDSAPQHLASAVGTPTVTVFGPTVVEFGFGPLADKSRTVGRDDLACRPCDRHGPQRCPLGHWKCMREIGVEQVYGVVRDVMGV